MGVAQRVERLADGVERLHVARTIGGRPLYWASLYRIGSTLVDTGPSSARPAVAAYLRANPPRDVLTTHEHEDHVGNHPALPPQTRVHAPALAKRFLDEGHPPFPLYRRIVWGYHEAAPGAHPLREAVEAEGRRFRVVPTPGHSDEHVAFLDEQDQALYSGDAYMGKFRAARLEEDVHTELRSLRRMAELDPAELRPAHGPVLPRPRERLLETAEQFEVLARKARAMKERGLDVRRIRKELLGEQPPLFYISLGEFSADKLIVNLLREPPAK